MEISTEDNIGKENFMVKENTFGLTPLFLKVIFVKA